MHLLELVIVYKVKNEYGTATETKAIAMKVTPKEICDKYHKLHSEIYKWFNISFDYFGRTSTAKQTEIAQNIFLKLYTQDLVFVDSVEQLFCASCERFLADRFVEGICPLCQYEDARGDQCDKCGKLINAAELKQPQCKLCRATPHLKSSKHLFLNLPKLEESVKKHIDKVTTTGHWSNTAKVIANSWLREGLKPRCITRDLKWGIPVPLEGFTDKVFYVWFDAPIGYLSITANYTDKWEQWWKQPDIVQLYQFMAKDNVPFHSIIFPACLIGSKDKYTVISHLAATEYLNYEDVKFSKSRGIGVFGDDAKDTGLPSDIWRFYLLYLRPEAQDTFFNWNDLMLKINSELLNNLGNFINRGLTFISNNFEGCIPEMLLEDGDKKLIAEVDYELKNYIQCMEKTRLRDAIKYMLNISRIGNQYIQSNKPWELVKASASEKLRAGTVLGLSANICCLLCTLMEPYMPDTCNSLKVQLNTQPIHHVLVDNFVCLLPPGHKIGKPGPLFKKIEQEVINELKAKYAGRQTPEKESSSAGVKKSAETKSVENSLPNGTSPEEIANIESLVTEQGSKVRDLKSNKASKAEIDKEVAVLLELKKRLMIAKGENPDQIQGKSKNKKKR
ncbi:methionine--tRNA ligase, cytoplasmic [Trichonephila clavipes]|nr:methionine--tRNA ligase, cytoplasmic [Trichonephila clavipes]